MASTNLRAVFSAFETVTNTVDKINRSLAEQRRELGSLTATQGVNSAAVTAAERAYSRLDNEIEDTTRSMILQQAAARDSALSMGALSVNVGAFTIALRDLGTQIPILVTTLGSVASVAGGAATAIITLTTAMTAFAAGGFIQVLEDVEESFAGIESTAEAMQAIMGALVDAFKDAMEPLRNEDNVELLMSMLQTFLDLVNRGAQFFEMIRPEMLGFIEQVQAGARSIDDLFESLIEGFIMVEPHLVNFFLFFINRLPDAILFMSKSLDELAPALSSITNSFIDLTTALVDMAGGVFPALAVMVNILLGILETLADVFNFLGDGLTELIFLIGIGTFVLLKLGDVAENAALSFLALQARMAQTGVATTTLTGKITALSAVMRSMAAQRFTSLNTLLKTIAAGLLPAITRLENGMLTVKGIQGFVRPKDIGLVGMFRAQIVQTSSALIAFAKRGLVTAAQGLASLAVRFGQAAVGALILGNTAILGVLNPGLVRTGVFSKMAATGMNLLRSSFSGLIPMIMGSIAALKGYIAAQSLANIAAGIFTALTGGILPILGALVLGGAALVGVLGNMGGITRTATNAFSALKQAIVTVANLALNILIPTWNIMVEVANFWLNILLLLPRLLMKVAEALGIAGSGGGLLGDIMSFLIDQFIALIEWLGRVLEMIDELLQRLNDLVGMGDGDTLSGLRVTEESVREGVGRSRDAADRDVATEPDVNLNFEDRVEQNVEVDADPEEREQLRRIVKDALNEANSIARRQQGHPG